MNEIPSDKTRKLRSSYISTVISISLVLFMLGLLGLLVVDAKKLSDYVKEHVQLNIFLKDGLSEEEMKTFTATVGEMSFAREARFVSKEEALDSLKRELGEDAVGMLETNPLPASVDVNVKAGYAHPDSMKRITEMLGAMPQVREVLYRPNEVEVMNRNFRTVAMVILLFCGVLLFIAIVLINNTIRLSLYSRRFLIKSMQLVGATRGFIRLPFIRRGLFHGLLAGLIGIGLLSVIIYLVHINFPGLGQLSDLRSLLFLGAGILIFGFLISGLSTWFAVNRHLRRQED